MARLTPFPKRILELKDLGYTYRQAKRKAKREQPKACRITKNRKIVKIND